MPALSCGHGRDGCMACLLLSRPANSLCGDRGSRMSWRSPSIARPRWGRARSPSSDRWWAACLGCVRSYGAGRARVSGARQGVRQVWVSGAQLLWGMFRRRGTRVRASIRCFVTSDVDCETCGWELPHRRISAIRVLARTASSAVGKGPGGGSRKCWSGALLTPPTGPRTRVG